MSSTYGPPPVAINRWWSTRRAQEEAVSWDVDEAEFYETFAEIAADDVQWVWGK